MKRFGLILAIILLFFAAQSSRAQDAFSIKANEGADTELLARALYDAYPNLKPDQQALVNQGLFFVMDYREPSAGVVAYGPEDDSEYDAKHGDTKLYPKGTIKVNLTLNSFEIMRVAYAVDDKRVQATLKWLLLEIVSHEVKHAQQYMNHPVWALTNPEQCPGGACDAERAKDTQAKMQYEFDATNYGFKVGRSRITKEEWEYAMAWLKNHRSVLGPRLVDFPEASFEQTVADPIPESTAWFYASMYQPVSLAATCASGKKWDKGEKTEAFNFLLINLQNQGALEKVYPYLTPVFERLKSCLRDQQEKPNGKTSKAAFHY